MPIAAGEIVGHLLATLASKGGARYGSEPVSVLQHALQCAALAERAGAPPALVAAALLHDYGHVMHDDEHAAARGRDMRHEVLAASYLARWFGPEVTEPIRLHVPAKRFLCTAEAGYFDALSAGSVQSLQVQGGPFTADEADRFIQQPGAAGSVELRRWDDLAKVPDLATPVLAHFRAALEACLR